VYKKCPTRYRQDYVEGLRKPGILQEALLKGSLAHKMIEEFLISGTRDGVLDMILPQWLEEECNLTVKQEDESLGIDPDLLGHYGAKVGHLIHRCGPDYHYPDKIRKKDGTCPKDPLEYPTQTFTYEMNQGRLYPVRQEIDMQATLLNPQFSRFSLANLVAKATAYFYNFSLPQWFSETISVEQDVSLKPVDFDGKRSWVGFIDWVYRTKDDAIVVCDHKSNAEEPTGLDVLYHGQLNLYAAILYEQTGKLPDYLAISHLPTGRHVLAKTDIRVVAYQLQYLRQIQQRIDLDLENESWLKAFPSDYATPCWRRNWKSKALDDVCPYLESCWPHYAETIRPELDAIWGRNYNAGDPQDLFEGSEGF
jgi:hypothetical protein